MYQMCMLWKEVYFTFGGNDSLFWPKTGLLASFCSVWYFTSSLFPSTHLEWVERDVPVDSNFTFSFLLFFIIQTIYRFFIRPFFFHPHFTQFQLFRTSVREEYGLLKTIMLFNLPYYTQKNSNKRALFEPRNFAIIFLTDFDDLIRVPEPRSHFYKGFSNNVHIQYLCLHFTKDTGQQIPSLISWDGDPRQNWFFFFLTFFLRWFKWFLLVYLKPMQRYWNYIIHMNITVLHSCNYLLISVNREDITYEETLKTTGRAVQQFGELIHHTLEWFVCQKSIFICKKKPHIVVNKTRICALEPPNPRFLHLSSDFPHWYWKHERGYRDRALEMGCESRALTHISELHIQYQHQTFVVLQKGDTEKCCHQW